MYKNILTELSGRVGTITINRPEFANAINGDTVLEITEAVNVFDKDPAVGAVVITGAGKHFSAGGDINRFKMLIETEQFLQTENIANADRMASAIRNCSKPVIAMINGVATGAGLSVALACDFRVVSPSSKMSMGFVNMGLPGDTGSIYFLVRLLGVSAAEKMMMRGEMYKGEELYKMGLATILAEEGCLAEETYKFAEILSAKSAAAIAAQKRMVNKYFFGDELESFYLDEQAEMTAASRLPDFKEATYAFLEKRKPEFNK